MKKQPYYEVIDWASTRPKLIKKTSKLSVARKALAVYRSQGNPNSEIVKNSWEKCVGFWWCCSLRY